MLDDAQFDVEGWLASEIAMEFAKAEGAAFVNGTGVNQPKGFLQSPVTDEVDDVRAFGALQYVASGAADGFAAANPEDRLIDLVQSLRAPYRQGAARSEEHTSELQSLMRISYAVFCLQKKNKAPTHQTHTLNHSHLHA